MKHRLLLIALVLVVFVSLSALPQAKTQQWEYKFVYDCNEKKANGLAVDGWELVAIESTSSAGIANNVSTYVFKRVK